MVKVLSGGLYLGVRLVVVVLLFVVLVVSVYLWVGRGGGSGCVGDVKGYVAPTLMPVVSAAAKAAGVGERGLLSIGSVEAVRRIQQGAVPDFFASVDVELYRDAVSAASPRQVFNLGRFRIALVCVRKVESLEELRRVRSALSDPTKAPIGYRELALVWLLYRDGWVDLRQRYEALGVRFVEWGGGVNITVPTVLSPSGLVEVAPNLDGSWSHLETGGVDCIFAHTPFIFGKFSLGDVVEETPLWEVRSMVYRGRVYYVHFFKPPYDFFDDPPYTIYVNYVDPAGRVLKSIRVVRFEAFVVSYSERGDCIVEGLKKVDLARYGLFRGG